MSIGQQLLDVPMGDMIRDMALAIAEAQIELDQNSIEVAEMMGGLKTIYDKDGNVTFEDSRIFFGKDKVTRQQAIDVHNSTTDTELKGEVDKLLASDNDVKRVGGTGEDKDDFELKPTKSGDVVMTIPARVSMMALGFAPNFYQFVDTIIEVRIAISMSREHSYGVEYNSESSTNYNYSYSRGRTKSRRGKSEVNYNAVSTTSVNASYSGKYNYSAEGSSLLRTKLTPIPPPAILEERIRRMMDAEFGE